jgi:predicted protein tyrosine phosphatase
VRILTICQGGSCRSVTLATLLKYYCGGHDALAGSLAKNSADTLRMLYNWADLVFVVEPKMVPMLEERIGKPAEAGVIDLGPDRWGMSMHPDLIARAVPLLAAAGFPADRSFEKIVAYGGKYNLRRQATEDTTL